MVGASVHFAQGDRAELRIRHSHSAGGGTVNERCTDYMNAMEQENALLGELTFAAPESDTIDKYADAVQDTASAWERLRSAETDGSTQSEVLKQVIDRTMKSYRVRQETFIAQLHDGTFDAVNYEALRTQGSYLTQYTDQLTAAFLM